MVATFVVAFGSIDSKVDCVTSFVSPHVENVATYDFAASGQEDCIATNIISHVSEFAVLTGWNKAGWVSNEERNT